VKGVITGGGDHEVRVSVDVEAGRKQPPASSTKWPRAATGRDGNAAVPLANCIGAAAREHRALIFDYLLDSRFVEHCRPKSWRLALDATAGIHGRLARRRSRSCASSTASLKYESFSTHVHTHMQRDVLKDRRGVCQDFAHVMIGLCRALKIPARYVSGYLATEAASATHAWVEVLDPRPRLDSASTRRTTARTDEHLRQDRQRPRLLATCRLFQRQLSKAQRDRQMQVAGQDHGGGLIIIFPRRCA
jgi:hypothetical protein